jgi:hypothetical protein
MRSFVYNGFLSCGCPIQSQTCLIAGIREQQRRWCVDAMMPDDDHRGSLRKRWTCQRHSIMDAKPH